MTTSSDTTINKAMAKELGRAGGEKTKEKYGSEHYKRIANKRWEKERAKEAKKKTALDK